MAAKAAFARIYEGASAGSAKHI